MISIINKESVSEEEINKIFERNNGCFRGKKIYYLGDYERSEASSNYAEIVRRIGEDNTSLSFDELKLSMKK